MAELKSFDPRRITATIVGALGSHVVSGYSNENTISIESGGDTYTLLRGVNGEAIRTRNVSSLDTTITFYLINSSPSINVFSQYKNLDVVNDSGSFSFTLNERNSGSTITSLSAYVLSITPGYSTSNSVTEVKVLVVNAASDYKNL
jgi:hypothetical protein